MHKIFLKIVILPLIFLISTILLNNSIYADVGEAPGPGGMISPGGKNDSIKMESERVVFNVISTKQNVFPYYKDAWYAHVVADFNMRNVTNSPVNMNVTFPYPSYYSDLTDSHVDFNNDKTINFKIYINDKEIEYKHVSYEYNIKEGNPLYYKGLNIQLMGIEFPVTFKEMDITKIQVQYDTVFIFEPKSNYGSFQYIMETGSHWEGSIGSGEIIFNFENELNTGMFLNLNDKFKINENKLIWEFKDLEPSELDNIKVTFSPQLINIWTNRDSKISKVITSEKSIESLFIDNDDLNNNYIEANYGPYENSAYNLLDKNMPKDNKGYYGWFSKTSNTDKYIIYEFDAYYNINKLNIFTSIPFRAYSNDNLEELHNVFDRPKTIKLTFSDGSFKDFSLEDKQNENITLEFDSIETSSIRLDIIDVYTDTILKTPYTSIARLSYEGDKTKEFENIVEDNEEITENIIKEDINFTYILIFLGIAVLSVLIVVIINIKIKSRNKIINNINNDKEREDVDNI